MFGVIRKRLCDRLLERLALRRKQNDARSARILLRDRSFQANFQSRQRSVRASTPSRRRRQTAGRRSSCACPSQTRGCRERLSRRSPASFARRIIPKSKTCAKNSGKIVKTSIFMVFGLRPLVFASFEDQNQSPKTDLKFQQAFRRIDPYQLLFNIDLDADRLGKRDQILLSVALDHQNFGSAGSHHFANLADRVRLRPFRPRSLQAANRSTRPSSSSTASDSGTQISAFRSVSAVFDRIDTRRISERSGPSETRTFQFSIPVASPSGSTAVTFSSSSNRSGKSVSRFGDDLALQARAALTIFAIATSSVHYGT